MTNGPRGEPLGGQFATLPETADLRRMAEATGTPAYVLFEQRVRDNYRELREALAAAEPVRVYYSVKSNFEVGLLAVLRDLGCGAEISGAVELLAAQRAGFAWKEMVFDGPLKSDADLAAAIDDGVHMVNVEFAGELDRLGSLARRAGRRVPVGVRIDPTHRPPWYHLIVRTYRGKFGLSAGALLPLAKRIARSPEVEWRGLLTHVGSQVTAAGPYLAALDRMFALAARLGEHGIRVDEINVGGGLPAAGMLNLRMPRRVRLSRFAESLGVLRRRAATSREIAQRIAARTVALRRRHGVAAALAVEPGRALVADAGIMLGRVHALKPPWVFVDLSLNHMPEKLSLAEWRLVFPGFEPNAGWRRGHIAGATLMTQDVLAYDCYLPPLREGDIVAVLDAGAYSISRANQFTRPRPPVFLCDRRGTLNLIRRAETPADVLNTQVAPAEGRGRCDTP